MLKLPRYEPPEKAPWAWRISSHHRRLLKEAAKASNVPETRVVEWLIDQQTKHPEKPPAIEDRPSRRVNARKMWNVRLPKLCRWKLEITSKENGMNMSEFLEWSIELYHAEHIAKPKS